LIGFKSVTLQYLLRPIVQEAKTLEESQKISEHPIDVGQFGSITRLIAAQARVRWEIVGCVHVCHVDCANSEQNQFAVAARNALTDFCFLWSSKTALQTSTHSLQIYTRLERSDGFEMSVSTSSWVLLQNEHRRMSSSSWRLRNMSPVWQAGAAQFKIH